MSTSTPTTYGAGISEDFVDVDGARVRVLRCADASPAGVDAEPQLLVHGLGGSAVTWVEVMAGLSRLGPVVAVDLPGFGGTRTTATSPATVDGYLAFLPRLLDALGWERVALHGNSMGGLVATLHAAAHPESVSRLVLVSPALPPASPLQLLVPSRATLDTMVPLALSSVGATALGVVGRSAHLDERRNREMLGLIFSDPDGVRPELLDLMAREFADPEPDVAADRRAALRTALVSIARLWTDPRRVWRAIDAVHAPTLVIGGTADALVPARVLRQVLRRRPTWQGHVIDDRRHALMMEDPATYLALVGAGRRGGAGSSLAC